MATATQQAGRARARRPVLTMSRRRTITGYIFISPFLLGVLCWLVIPAGVAGWLSFQEWDLITPPDPVGFKNFARLSQDALFWQSLKVTTNYTLIAVPLAMVLGFLLALLMNSKVRGIRAFRTMYYMPSIVPVVASAVLWAWIFNPEFGLLNILMRALGLPKVNWLLEPEWALPALILMSLWTLGASMVVYLAGLQGIPQEYYEAAEIDGAGRWAKLWSITIPLMSPVIFFSLIIGIIGSFQVFTAGYLLTDGGPQNATLFYTLYLYHSAFRYFEMGYAAALAWVLFFIILALTLLVVKYIGRWVYYEEPR
jgi:multiple sugar transport system permease protein